jgi:hypothetical protein
MGIQNENPDLNSNLTHYYKLPVERTAKSLRSRELLQRLETLKPQFLVEVGSDFNFICADSDEEVSGTVVRVHKSCRG